jgi:DNA adenine methylase
VAEPFVKAVGGKRQLLPVLETMLPERWGRFYEPFAGGAALMWRLEETGKLGGGAVLNDSNERLMMAYQGVRDDVERVIDWMEERVVEFDGRAYARMVQLYNASRANHPRPMKLELSEHAALYILISRSCFNGIHRVNRRGELNVPWNGKRPTVRADELRACAKALRGVELRTGDFAAALADVRAGDLVLGDSPYDETFSGYQAEGFGPHAQTRMAEAFGELDRGGVRFIVTNSDTALIRRLWGRYRLTASAEVRAVNNDGDGRAAVPCLIVTNY